jgi:hypothetical protein
MDPQLRNIHENILSLALGALAHANRHACYHDRANRWWPALSVLQAAHSAELIIKARIAQEHPLLIFEEVPRSTRTDSEMLDFETLFERGKTVQFFDLPERLWATTGIRISDIALYQSFGRLRNALQHFSPDVSEDLSGRSLEFVFGIIDPLINDCWGLFAVDYDEDEVAYEYMLGPIISREILFRVPASLARMWHGSEIQSDLKDVSQRYREQMNARARRAMPTTPTQGGKKARPRWQSPWPWYGSRDTFDNDGQGLIACEEAAAIPVQEMLRLTHTEGDDSTL